MYFVSVGELKNYEYFALSEMYESAMSEFGKTIRDKYTTTADTDALKELIEEQ